MINNVKGVMAGIGDMLNDVNVIEPGFDARVYRYIIGKDCIIEGLEMSGNTLSAGICIGQGYRGYLPTSCEIGTIYDYIYAHFKVHHDRDIEDEFWIECTKSSTVVQNDILHGAGDYWLLLYQKVNGKWQKRIDDIKYPLRSQHSDDTMRVVEHGVLENGVTAVTQEVGDKTVKVATTEFVQNQIAADIDAEYGSLISEVFSEKKENKAIFTLEFIRKSKLCVFSLSKEYVYIKDPSTIFNDSIPNGSIIMQLPEKLRPKMQFDFYIQRLKNGATPSYLEKYIMKSNGDIVAGEDCTTTTRSTTNIGYETN